MSRSRSKYPIKKDYGRNSTKIYKRFASKAIRKFKDSIVDGNSYRKIYNPYNIHDWKYSEWDPLNEWYKLLKRK